MRQTTAPTPEREATPQPAARSRLSILTNSPIVESLRIRDFRWMWFGSLASFMAMNMMWITNGWLVLRFWESELLADVEAIADGVARAVRLDRS